MIPLRAAKCYARAVRFLARGFWAQYRFFRSYICKIILIFHSKTFQNK